MKCHIVEDLLPEYVEGLCSEETAQEIEAHLAECSNCQSKLDNMQDEREQSAPGLEEIRPFQKIEKEFKKNRMIKVTAVVLLVLVCGVFGVLTVGQIFPTLPCPSYDSLMYRFRAKEIAQQFAEGNMEEILMAKLKKTPNVVSEVQEYTSVIADVGGHLKGYYEKCLKGRDVTINVDGVTYDSNETLEDAYVEKWKPKSKYLVELTLRADDDVAHMQIVFINRDQYSLYVEPEGMMVNDRFITDGFNVDEGVDQNSWVYNISNIESWLSHFELLCQGYTWGNMMLNRGISRDQQGIEELGDARSWMMRMSYYFTKDCNQYGVRNGDTGYTEYSQKVSDELVKIFEKCQNSDFKMIDGEYNEEVKKHNAVLYWRVTDLKGKEYVLRKEFYYGVTGYEPVDENEEVFSDTGADEGMISSLKTVFD